MAETSCYQEKKQALCHNPLGEQIQAVVPHHQQPRRVILWCILLIRNDFCLLRNNYTAKFPESYSN